jgi:hypothetical protein
MTDTPADPQPPESDTAQLSAQMRQLVGEINAMRLQAESHLRQIEVAARKADSEALLAFNAKRACEEHATAIAGAKGVVEADANAIATNKQRSDEALASLTTGRATVEADIQLVANQRKEIDQAAGTVSQAVSRIEREIEAGAAKLTVIDTLKESAEGQLLEVTQSAKNAARSASDAASAQNRAEQSSAESASSATAISSDREAASGAVEKTFALLTQAQTAAGSLKSVLEHLAKSDEIATGHEKRVSDLTEELQGLIHRVEGLLPGATSAGLASSFNKQRSRFVAPQKQWLWTFVVCIGVLVVLALPSFFSAIGVNWVSHPTEESWNGAWLHLVLRLPIIFPVVWLAIYAGRNYMMSLRMEEDYAYKEAISTAFEGYKREMEKIGTDDGEKLTPITILCTNILRAISERPGRIYEGKQQDINLATEIQNALEKSVELSKKTVATQ